jgi:hypothetical protein
MYLDSGIGRFLGGGFSPGKPICHRKSTEVGWSTTFDDVISAGKAKFEGDRESFAQ